MKLSIITINRNNKDGLQKTIESAILQSFQDYEYIIIDGASTDGSVDVIKQHADNITYWVSEPDKGIYNAMNKGIFQANGEYCLFLNSGDYLINNTILEKAFRLNIQTDIFCTKAFDKSVEELTFFDLYQESLKHQSMFIKTSLFDKIGLYNENYKIISDWIFYVLALIKYNCSLSFYDFDLFVAQEGGVSWTDETGIFSERELFMKREFSLLLNDYKQLEQYKRSRFIRVYDKILNLLMNKKNHINEK